MEDNFIYFGNYERRDYSTLRSQAPNDTPMLFSALVA